MQQQHIPVLLQEAIEILKPEKGIIIDATVGLGGHAKAILKDSKVSIIGLDQDGEALGLAKKTLSDFKNRVVLLQENFGHLKEIVEEERVLGKVNGIIIDLGVSSLQLENPKRGFSFQKEGPLDMRMDERAKLTAYQIVNSWPKEKIFEILRSYGEERFAGRIANSIVTERRKKKIETTLELSEIVKKAVPFSGKIHPATRTFQALRIAVNEELLNLERALKDSVEVLAPKGKIIVISFHSLEDRIVKRFFKDMKGKSFFNILTKKPIRAALEEVNINPRSRSARLRAAEKI